MSNFMGEAVRVVVEALRNGGPLRRCDARGMTGERFLDAPLLQPAGFDSVPPDGQGCAIALRVGGDHEQTFVIARDDRDNRPADRPSGSVTLYALDGSGDEIAILPDEIRVTSAARPIRLRVGEAALEITGAGITLAAGEARLSLNADGVEANVDIVADGISLVTHRHGESGAPV